MTAELSDYLLFSAVIYINILTYLLTLYHRCRYCVRVFITLSAFCPR